MKIVLMSDLHLLNRKPDKRSDDILESQWEKLEYIFKYCVDHNGILLQAGDMFDKPRDWNVLDRFISLVQTYYPIKIYSIYGQHDMYQRNIGVVCNMSLLESLGFVETLNQNHIHIDGINLYGCSFGEKPENKEGILVIHAPITCTLLYPGMEYNDAKAFLKKYNKYQLILCGDIHVPFIQSIKDRHIVNTGCMVRKTIKDNFDPRFYVYDTEKKTIETVYIPRKPFDEIFQSKIDNETKAILEDFIKEITDYENTGTDILKNIHSFIDKNNLSEDVKTIIYQVMEDKHD
jgi:hypothetical protein